ncbi:MAG: tRNA (adenosine(37)-N6)-threonylcarbamoyltransferase complex transferase subunit TsaD [Thermoguttaceae bacterium]
MILTIETTCDETAAAIIGQDLTVHGSVVASQHEFHVPFGGVVPELASRAHLERIVHVVDEVVRQAGIDLADLDAIAVANTPGLAGSLLVGLAAAKSLCVALDKPLIAIDHLQAHVYACKIGLGVEPFPCLGLIVSGGHSSLYRCEGATDFTLLGSTIDDAAGEAFDKVASMLGLEYPGGPSIEQAAKSGNPKAFAFPRALLDDPNRLQFSFSGIKTAVRYKLIGPGKNDFSSVQLSESEIADIAASFQEAVVDVLVGKAIQALKRHHLQTLCVGGGVAANGRFREKMETAAKEHGFELYIAPRNLCTDNAIMGGIAIERFKAGLFEPLDLDILPGLVRH